jgi:small-conductance mechanosensitive channel
MKKQISVSGLVTLVLGFATFLWLVFHVYEIRTDLPGLLRFDASDPSDYLAGAGYLVMLLFHAAAFLFIFRQARIMKRFGGWQVLGLVLGVFSLFAIAAEKVMYDEIGREWTIEFPLPGEVSLLYACLGVNVLFSVFMIVAAFRAELRVSSPLDQPASKDERIFTLAQVLGIVSGVTGLLLTAVLLARRWPSERFWIFIPFYVLFLIPYGLAVLYWLGIKRKERMSDWYDEKQVRDMMKASLGTLVLSIPGMAVLALAPGPVGFYWFPYYLFLVLTLFSTGTLYCFKRD